jgi:mono/diheme cytochrome c family protein
MKRKERRFEGREWFFLVLTLVGLLVVMQLLPIGAEKTNPPTIAEPPWDSPATRDLFQRACADCHSNETTWPWYANLAPSSWLVAHDVVEGREHLNASEWNRPQKDARKAADEVRHGEMPPTLYLVAHSEARLSADEKAQLVAGLDATFGAASATNGDDLDAGALSAADAADGGDSDLDAPSDEPSDDGASGDTAGDDSAPDGGPTDDDSGS